jgi:uncharacterized protein YecE (DUF72 family)
VGRTRIGVSGWSYASWEEGFYPPGLPRKRRLEHVGRVFDTVEVNGSFYSLLTPGAYRRWYEQTPPGFVFAVKGSRFVTHNKKLADAEVPLANFMASGVFALEEKLGPFLWQLPATLRFDAERVRAFLELLPRTTAEAARLARRHDARVREPLTAVHARRPLRHALEARHESFFTEDAVRVLREASVALVVSDSASWRRVEEVTAGFVYVRLHGRPRTYASRYSDEALGEEARKIRAWALGRMPVGAARVTGRAPPRRKSYDVYVYFDNDALGHAPRDALRLIGRVAGGARRLEEAHAAPGRRERARSRRAAARVGRRPRAGADAGR